MSDKQTALVTGAGRGIGLANGEATAGGRFDVMVDLAAEPMNSEAAKLREAYQSVEHHVLSITDRAAVSTLMARVKRLDVLVNNAAVFWDGKFDAVTEDDFKAMYEVNVVGTFVMSQEALKTMKRGGRIVNVASRAYLAGYAHAPYITSKAGTSGLTRGMAIDLAEKGIFVNAIAPGLYLNRHKCFRRSPRTPAGTDRQTADQDGRSARRYRQRNRVLRRSRTT